MNNSKYLACRTVTDCFCRWERMFLFFSLHSSVMPRLLVFTIPNASPCLYSSIQWRWFDTRNTAGIRVKIEWGIGDQNNNRRGIGDRQTAVRDALGITKKHWARHWGLKTDKDRILAIGRRLGEGLMKTLSRKKKSDLKLEMWQC